MPTITITAVNTATDELTAVAHGLTTGDRFRLRNVDGALPAASPGLAAATDYFALRTGADTIKVYDTSAHAVAGGGTGLVDITGAGSGTNKLEYGLPYCIPRIATPLSQVFSADSNSEWTALAALHQFFTGGSQSIWTEQGRTRFRPFYPLAAAFTTPANWTTGIATGGPFLKSLASDNVLIHVPCETGDRITGLTYAALGNGTVDATSFLVVGTGNQAVAGTTIGSSTDTNRAAAWGDVVLAGPFTPHVMAAGEALLLQIVPNSSAYQVGRCLLQYDRL